MVCGAKSLVGGKCQSISGGIFQKSPWIDTVGCVHSAFTMRQFS